MDLTSGKFTVPRPGIYFFSFTGTARLYSSSMSNSVDFHSNLFLNGNVIGSSHIHEGNYPVKQWSSFTHQSTLNLKKGDQLWVELDTYGRTGLHDTSHHFTHFTGWMLEEEIGASL
jgi:hypothetical protein